MHEKQVRVPQQIERRRRTALEERPLTLKEVTMLSSLHWKNELLFGKPDYFYSDDYKKVMETTKRPVTQGEIQQLLQVLGRDGKPKYTKDDFVPIQGKSAFLTEEQAKDLLGLEHIEKYRKATAEEANILYSDIYSREVTEGME